MLSPAAVPPAVLLGAIIDNSLIKNLYMCFTLFLLLLAEAALS